MQRYIVSGRYSIEAMKGMLAHPSDREAATRALIEAGGGKMDSYYLTTGDYDFVIIAQAPSLTDLVATLLVAGAAGGTSALKTSVALTSAEFLSAQKKAQGMVAAYKAPN
jgi:uncharacterized protein with GYD domain